MDDNIRKQLALISFLGGPFPTKIVCEKNNVTILRFTYGDDETDCLLKVYHGDLTLTETYRQIAEITRKNDRCGLAKIYDVMEWGSDVYVIEERVQGHTLREEIRARVNQATADEEDGMGHAGEGSLFSKEEVVSIGLQLCEALEIMHRNGLNHLDIKPENIMVQIDKSIRLIDFDGSLLDHGGEAIKSKRDTFYYAAPEQLNGQKVSARTDIYQVGLVLYELMYNWSTQESILTREAGGAVVFPGKNRALNHILEKCLKIRQRDRYKSVRLLSRKLNRLTTAHIGDMLFILMVFAVLLILARILTGFLLPAGKSGVDIWYVLYGLYPVLAFGSLYTAYRMHRINEPFAAVCIIAFQLVFMLDPFGPQDGSHLFIRDLRSPKQEELRKEMADTSGYDESSIYEFQYDDFDRDGDYEAFALIGAVNWDIGVAGEKYVGEIWFADGKKSYPLSARETFSGIGYMEQILSCRDEKKLVFFNSITDAGERLSHIYMVKEGRVMESVLSKKGCVMSWDGVSKGEMRVQEREGEHARKEIMYIQAMGDLRIDDFYNEAYSMPIRYGFMSYTVPTFNYKQEAELERTAAEQGDPVAQLNIGYMYSKGLGVEKNYKEALKWYTLAADQGLATAQFCIGVMYEHGIGVEEDIKEALKWYRMSAEGGYAEAEKKLEEFSDQG